MKDGLAAFIYRTILKPAPLRWLANRVLLLLLPEKISLPEGILFLNQEDPVISGALTLGVYENFELELFRTLLKEGMIVLDIGANIGIYTTIAAKLVGENGKVISCEPEPVNFAILQKNVLANSFTNVTLFAYAIADHEGTMELHLSDTNKGNHSLVKTQEYSPEFADSLLVSTITGDVLLAKQNIVSVDVLKMDIEGAEPLALTGLKNTLAQTSVLIFEFSPRAFRNLGSDPVELLSSVYSAGFEIFQIQESKRQILRIEDFQPFVEKFSGSAYANLICIRSTAAKESIAKFIALSSKA